MKTKKLSFLLLTMLLLSCDKTISTSSSQESSTLQDDLSSIMEQDSSFLSEDSSSLQESSSLEESSSEEIIQEGITLPVSYNVDVSTLNLSVWTDFDILGTRAPYCKDISNKGVNSRHSIHYEEEKGKGKYLFAIDANGYIVYATYGFQNGYGGPSDEYYCNQDIKDASTSDYYSLSEYYQSWPNKVIIDGKEQNAWRLYDFMIPQGGMILTGYYQEASFQSFYSYLFTESIPTATDNAFLSSYPKKGLDGYYVSINDNKNINVRLRHSDELKNGNGQIIATPTKCFVESSSDAYIDPLSLSHNIDSYYDATNQDIYRINIETSGTQLPFDKETYISGSLSIVTQTNEVKMASQDMGIKLRGNSTLGADKKAYRIKFDEKQSLFGLIKAKSWVLLANYYDKSNIRNYLAYLTANKLSYLGFQPSSIFVDVYMNQTYQGLYLLCEQMQTGQGRVNIENKKDGNLNSFMLEADERAKDEGTLNVDYIRTSDYDFAFKYPEVEDIDEENLAWIQNYMDTICKELKNRTTDYHDLIDVKSFIDYYIVEELFKNVDVGSTSQYYIVDQSNKKLQMGPVWDFDISLGVIGAADDGMYSSYEYTNLFVRSRDNFYHYLFENESFQQEVSQRYSQIRYTILQSIFDEYENVIVKLAKAQQRNIDKWGVTYSSSVTTWIEKYYAKSYRSCVNLNEHYDLMLAFLKKQFQILDQEYLI